MGILIYIETQKNDTIFGCINQSHKKSINCDYTFDEYMNSFYSGKIPTAIVKVWTGR
jgi:hypothetical protein